MLIRSLCLAALLALPAPVAAQSGDSFGERLLEDFLRGTEDTLRELLNEARPELEQLLRQLENLPMYEAPEILPNGDIIIRRVRPDPGADGATEI